MGDKIREIGERFVRDPEKTWLCDSALSITVCQKGILSGSKSYGKETVRIIERLQKSVNGYKIKSQHYFNKDNSWKEEIDEFANIIIKKLSVKTGNVLDAFKVMTMVEKIYNEDKKGF